VPTSAVLQTFNLRPGKNLLTYKIKKTLKTVTLKTRIFLYDNRTKLFISDVDGTITRSDVMGHVIPFFGGDWSQSNICKYYSNIVHNGIQVVYLTARAIGQVIKLAI